MSFKKFGQNDILINTMMASPHCEFFIYDGDIFYNNTPSKAGTSTAGGGGYAVSEVRMVSPGSISLYEYNIDRPDLRYGPFGADKIIGELAATLMPSPILGQNPRLLFLTRAASIHGSPKIAPAQVGKQLVLLAMLPNICMETFSPEAILSRPR